MLNSELIIRILRYVKPYKLRLVIIFTSLIIVAFSLISLGEALKDFVNLSGTVEEINYYMFRIIALILIFGIGSFVRSFYVNFLAEQVVSSIRVDVVRKLLNLNISFYDSAKISEIIVKITTSCEIIGNIVINSLSFLVRNFVIAIFSIAMMFYQSVVLAITTLLLFSIVILPIILFRKRIKRLTKQTTEMFNKIASNIEEILSNIRLVYSFGQKKNILELVDKENSLYLDYYKERTKLRSLFFSSSIMGVFLSIVVVLWIGTIHIAEGQMTRGVLVAFLFYSVTVSLSLSGIFEVVSDFQKYLTAAEQVFEIIDSKEIENNNGTISDIGRNIEKISFSNINFSYPTRPNNQVLKDLSFEINSGEIIGIVGKSGFGKSTIMQLLLKFYEIKDGSILINGKNINDIETNYLRSLISITPQEPYIFSSTIFDNIKFARPDATDDEINEIAELTLINEFTSKFKDGLKTPIGNKGVQISGGQRQRIAIARSLLKKPEILILDEATNALDTSLEKEIFKNIKSLMQNRIIIMIGHRSKIMEFATKIFVVNEHGIIASGTHEELMKNSEFYQKLSMEEL